MPVNSFAEERKENEGKGKKDNNGKQSPEQLQIKQQAAILF